MSKSKQPTKVDGRTTAEQIRNISNLSGIGNIKRWQMLQKVAHEVCDEFFAPEWQWKDILNEDVVKAREAIQDRDPLLPERPDIAH